MKALTLQNRTPLLSTLALALLSTAAYAAPTIDAGQISRELQNLPNLAPVKPAAGTLPPEAEPVAAPKAAESVGDRVNIKTIHVYGSYVFSASELEKLVSKWVGADRSLSDLSEAAETITSYYRKRGYAVATAYVPPQEVKNGEINIRVVEGQIGKVTVKNKALVSDKVSAAYVKRLRRGDVLQAKQVDRAVLLLNDTPGVGGSRASLQPGASVGTTDLLIELDPDTPFSANVELDNYGNRYSGEYRVGSAMALNSPFKMGDQITARVLATAGGMTYVRLGYQIPVGSNGLKVGGAYADTRYKLGKEFASIKAHGTAGNASLYVTYPFVRSRLSSLSGTATLESKKLADYEDSVLVTTDKKVQLLNLGLAGNYQDELNGAGLTSYDVSLVGGKLSMDATSLATDAASAKSNGSYAKLGYNLSRLQRLTDLDNLSLAFSGQQASKNLNSSEKFSLGGANGVRAYPQGEGIGDQGWMVNLEVRHNLNEIVQGIAFYDAGSVKLNHTAYTTTENTRSISGVGVGANAHYQSLQFKAALAWRTGGGQAQAEPATLNRNPRLWVQVSAAF